MAHSPNYTLLVGGAKKCVSTSNSLLSGPNKRKGYIYIKENNWYFSSHEN
jgi:hypothetical protein